MNSSKIKYISKLIFINAIILLLLLEFSFRLYWTAAYKVPFFNTSKMIYAFYPELKSVDNNYEKNNHLKILILDGSTLHPLYGMIDSVLASGLKAELKRDVDIYNLAELAHTSKDCALKYNYLKNYDFDYIVLYNGINDACANYSSREDYDFDYGHFWNYYLIDMLNRHREVGLTVIPYTVSYMVHQAGLKITRNRHYEPCEIKDEYLNFGSSFKVGASFRKNILSIIESARMKKQKVIIPSFAYYIPFYYSDPLFQQKALDYGRHRVPIRIYGSVEGTKNSIDSINGIILDIKSSNSDIVFWFDLNASIVKNKLYFDDICHFTDKGIKLFSDSLIAIIVSDISSGSIH